MIIRDLIGPDFTHGFFETLASLADVGLNPNNPEDLAQASAMHIKRLTSGVLTFVAIQDELVTGTVSLVPDYKFIHGCSLVYHLEDVAVHINHQGQGIGLALINHAITQATTKGAYKIVLNCYDDLIKYYAKVGFHQHDLCLRLDLQAKPPAVYTSRAG